MMVLIIALSLTALWLLNWGLHAHYMRRVRRRAHLRSLGHMLPTTLALVGGLSLFVVLIGATCCGPLSQQKAAAASVDVARCLAQGAAHPGLSRFVEELARGEDWKTALPGLATGPLAGALVCALASVATRLTQEATVPIGGPAQLIQERADTCAGTLCTSVEQRAAAALADMARRKLVRLPPSGQE